MVRALVLAIALTGCLADKLLLWPPAPAPIGGLERRLVDGSLEVLVARTRPEEPEAFVLQFYGNGELAQDSLEHEASELADLRLEVWGVNYPGYGASRGPATLRGVARSARQAYAALAKRAAGRPIIVVGNSMGAAAALHVAATERVAGVVLHNPPPLKQLVLRRHGWWNLWLLAVPVAIQIPDELDAITNAERATAPALFLGSQDDGVVPFRYQERIMKAYRGDWELAVVPGGHNDPLPAWAQDKILAALAAWMRPAR